MRYSPKKHSGYNIFLPTQYSRFVLVDNSVDGKIARRPVSRVLSGLAQKARGRDGHSSGTRIAARLARPTRAAGRERPCVTRSGFPSAPPATPIRSCSRWGLPCRPCCQGRGALLPHRFTRADWPWYEPWGESAVCFLWHCPWGRPRRPLAGTVFPWSPDFPPPRPGRLRSRRRERSSGRPAVWHSGNARRRGGGQAPSRHSQLTPRMPAWESLGTHHFTCCAWGKAPLSPRTRSAE